MTLLIKAKIASKKADELKEKAINKANDLTKEALKKAQETIKQKIIVRSKITKGLSHDLQ